jgi:glutamyl-Q tRNA(Asp) synthetase
MSASGYVGRFAPSPTGPLHFGSLVAALGSCLEARLAGGRWLLRMEDVDAPRCSPAAAADILRTLEACGFAWDGEVMLQSRRAARYREALDRLVGAGLAYPCACSRRELADAAPAVDGAAVYPGTCRGGLPPGRRPRAWRLRVPAEEVAFADALQGACRQQLEREVGDFVLLRADGCFAYQLAVVVDDADQGVTHVVRGADLLDSTPRQIFLQRCLGLPTPAYLHLPVAVDAAGQKLSKQSGAPAVAAGVAASALVEALAFLGQRPPLALARAGVKEVWAWALAHWRIEALPGIRARPYSGTVVVPTAVAGDADGQPHCRVGEPARRA